jgi:hypothetical protein
MRKRAVGLGRPCLVKLRAIGERLSSERGLFTIFKK